MTSEAKFQMPTTNTGYYEQVGERATQPFATTALNGFMPIDGLSLLDVGAGTGGLAVAAASRGAHVTAIDINTTMILRCQERLKSFDLCSAEVMDFCELKFAASAFDIAVSNFGILAYLNWQAGLAEMVRVTRSSGHIALVMWTHGHDCSPAHVMKRVFNELFPDREIWPSGMFPAFSEDSLKAHLARAGCYGIDVQFVSSEWIPLRSEHAVAECVPMFNGFPGFAALSGDELALVIAELEMAFRAYADREGIIRLPTKAFLVTAKKM